MNRRSATPFAPRRRVLLGGLLAALVLTPPSSARGAAELDQTHAKWTSVLRAHVKGERFDYGALKEDRGAFDAYIAQLTAVTPEDLEGWTPDERFAFWINAYNAFTIQKVVDEYPLKSIRKLDGAFGLSSVFDREFIPLRALHPDGDDDDLSLNDIEHGILRKRFPDARVHAAINCAATSCPPLRNEAYVATRLDEQLTEQMRSFVRNPKLNRLGDDRLRLSEIFKWFAEDFERDAGSVREYVARYAPEAQRASILEAKVSYLDYDWDLNDAK